MTGTAGFCRGRRDVRPCAMLFLVGLVVFSLSFISASAAGPERLHDATDSRARVTNVAYSYYPDKAELRVRLTLANGFEKYAVYRDAVVIQNVLTVLRHDVKKLHCIYRDNDVIAIIAE